MLGKRISPILVEIEETLWEFEDQGIGPMRYPEEAFRAALKIFMSVILDKMWELQSDEDMEMNTREVMAEKVGQELRRIVKIYTGIDTHKLYEVHN